MMQAEYCEATSPVVSILQAVRTWQPTWAFDIGRPRGPGWIPGTALMTATEGPVPGAPLLTHMCPRSDLFEGVDKVDKRGGVIVH
jgi:hypothetical protein